MHRNYKVKRNYEEVYIFFGALLMMMSCAKKDGIYPADKGWDCFFQSQEYRFRVEPDGLYLYTSFDHGDGQKLEAFHKLEGNSLSDCTYLYLNFLCVNKDNDYVYMISYDNVYSNYRGIPIKAITFDIDGKGAFIVKSEECSALSLLDKYLKR